MLHVSVSLCVCVLFLCWCWKRRLDRRPHIVKLSLKKKKKLFPRWWKCGENNKPPALCAMTDVFSWEKPHKHTDYSHSLLLCNNYTCWQDVLLLLIPYKLMDAEIFCSMNNGICWKCPSPEVLLQLLLPKCWRAIGVFYYASLFSRQNHLVTLSHPILVYINLKYQSVVLC